MLESRYKNFKFKEPKANENAGGKTRTLLKVHLLYPQAGAEEGAFVSSEVKTNQKENMPGLARQGGEKYLILSNQKHFVQPEHSCVS